MPDSPDGLVLGPLLRRVSGTTASVWVQTAVPATVEVRAGPASGAARTFTAYGRHYALVCVEGLPPASETPYRVLVDGREVWPADDGHPPSVIRTRAEGQPVRLVFGSCRQSTYGVSRRFPPDALDAYAVRLASAIRAGTASLPDSLVLLGDQVYADEPSPAIRRWLRRHRHRRRPDAPPEQVVDFGEYSRLYLESWSDPEARWLLSTVPSVMIFDDHEIIDDWNTSEAWRTEMHGQSWWAERIASGLASYWVYQHLGNLDPTALAADPLYRAVRSAPDATGVLAEFGARADAERSTYRWSYALDFGRTRLVVLDNRAGRQLGGPEGRVMLPDAEWRWFVGTLAGEYDHLVLGSSLPWLLPPAIHHIEALSERLCDSDRGWIAGPAERLRQSLDLEHWAAFGRSFTALAALLGQVGSPDGGLPTPATLSVLSGDVHHSYVARARLGPEVHSRIYQLTCSPVHNRLPPAMRPAVRFGWSRGAAAAGRALARLAGTPGPGLGWDLVGGPYFGNAVGTLVHSGRSAHATIEGTTPDGALHPFAELDLT